ncbi:sodium:solute symporter family protein [Candidatus Pelagibacter sp. HIMB1517]|uniref:sodium:solute symporter family protein n=1 Tax=Candidatus Pelagibacter sp. HIMB1517 TaxID=3413341 RepID=UPI003F84EC8E
MFKGNFIDNLPKIYGTYTGGFLVFCLLMALLEANGVSAKTIGILFLVFTIAIYALIGILSRTMQADAYYVAGRQVPTVFNGMATAADWMSGASFVAMAGGIFYGGYTYMAFLVGWTGGYVLVSSLLAPYLRKFGCYTVPDFIGTRYGGNFVRACAVLVLVLASFTYVTAQINATGTIASRFLGIPFELGVWVGLVSILLCSMLGGMRAVTWTQVAQYIVLIIAYLLPIFWLSNKFGFGFFPQFMLGDEVARLGELEQQYGLVKNSAAAVKSAGVPGGLKSISVSHSGVAEGGMAAWKFISLAICMMVGTASLPHILMRYFTTPSVKSARRSVAWSLFFIFLLYFSAPALATLAKISILDPNLATGIIGKSIADVQSIAWVKEWIAVKQAYIADFNGDGILQLNEWFMRGDVIVLATPEMGGLPYVISGLVAAGGMAAAMSTADGLILAISNALSHDVYYKIVDPKADVAKRLIVARILLVVTGAFGAYIASMRLTGILGSVAWAFDFAMSGLFFPLVLGVWWKRATRQGAIAGMLLGLGAGTAYLIYVAPAFMGQPPILGIDHLRFGLIGAPVCLISMVVVSLMTPEPDAKTQAMVDEVRIPSGKTVL